MTSVRATWPQTRTDEPWSYEPGTDGLWAIKYLVKRVHCVRGLEQAAINHVAYENWRYQHPKAEYQTA